MTQYDVSREMKRPLEFCNKVEHGAQLLNFVEFMVYCRAIKTTAAEISVEAERRALLKAQPLSPRHRK